MNLSADELEAMELAQVLEHEFHEFYGPLNVPGEDEIFDALGRAARSFYQSAEPLGAEVEAAAKELGNVMRWAQGLTTDNEWLKLARAALTAARKVRDGQA